MHAMDGERVRNALVLRVRVVDMGNWARESPGGIGFDWELTIGRARYSIKAHHSVFGDDFVLYRSTGFVGDETAGASTGEQVTRLTGDFDEDQGTVRVELPLALLPADERRAPAHIKRVWSSYEVTDPTGSTSDSADSMVSKRAFRLDTGRCSG